MLSLAGLSVFVSAIYLAVLTPGMVLVRMLNCGLTDPLAWILAAFLIVLTAVPLAWLDGPWPHSIMARILGSACNYFPITVKLEARNDDQFVSETAASSCLVA